MESLALYLSGLFTAPAGNFRSWFLKIIMSPTLIITLKILSHSLWFWVSSHLFNPHSQATHLCTYLTLVPVSVHWQLASFVSFPLSWEVWPVHSVSHPQIICLAHSFMNLFKNWPVLRGHSLSLEVYTQLSGLPVVTWEREHSCPSPVAAFILLCKKRSLLIFLRDRCQGASQNFSSVLPIDSVKYF